MDGYFTRNNTEVTLLLVALIHQFVYPLTISSGAMGCAWLCAVSFVLVSAAISYCKKEKREIWSRVSFVILDVIAIILLSYDLFFKGFLKIDTIVRFVGVAAASIGAIIWVVLNIAREYSSTNRFNLNVMLKSFGEWVGISLLLLSFVHHLI